MSTLTVVAAHAEAGALPDDEGCDVGPVRRRIAVAGRRQRRLPTLKGVAKDCGAPTATEARRNEVATATDDPTAAVPAANRRCISDIDDDLRYGCTASGFEVAFFGSNKNTRQKLTTRTTTTRKK